MKSLHMGPNGVIFWHNENVIPNRIWNRFREVPAVATLTDAAIETTLKETNNKP